MRDDRRTSDFVSRLKNNHLVGPARALHARLVGLDLQAAEAAIEGARRVAWTAAFSGGEPAAVARALEIGEPGASIGVELASLSLQNTEEILHELRLMLYVNAFGQDPRSRFGALFATVAGSEVVDGDEPPRYQ